MKPRFCRIAIVLLGLSLTACSALQQQQGGVTGSTDSLSIAGQSVPYSAVLGQSADRPSYVIAIAQSELVDVATGSNQADRGEFTLKSGAKIPWSCAVDAATPTCEVAGQSFTLAQGSTIIGRVDKSAPVLQQISLDLSGLRGDGAANASTIRILLQQNATVTGLFAPK